MNNNPIGIFDSGLGGLSVWREIAALLPGESLLYYGDGLNCPYGSKPVEEIRRYGRMAVEWLTGQGAKMIVVACNTATAAGIAWLRESYPGIPFVGMEPAVKPAAQSTRTGVVGVLATEASLEGELYRETAAKYAEGVELLSVPGRGFVELVERGRQDSDQARQRVAEVMKPLLDAGADRIVLGCTHYPFLADAIAEALAGRDVEIIDPAPAVARQAERLLDYNGLRAGVGHVAEYRFHTLADDAYLDRMVSMAARISGGGIVAKKH